jgi:hypothetical protein
MNVKCAIDLWLSAEERLIPELGRGAGRWTRERLIPLKPPSLTAILPVMSSSRASRLQIKRGYKREKAERMWGMGESK